MNAKIDFRVAAEEAIVEYPASNLYFLLDHGGLAGLHRQLLRVSLEWTSLFDCTTEANALAVAPILILAARDGGLRMSRSLLAWLGENGTYTSTVIMLSSPLQIGPLKDRLAARLDVKLSEDMEAMLRFFDPRVLESLIGVMSADQVKAFFSPAESWRYVDRSGKLVAIATDFNAQEKLSLRLVLSQGQESALLAASEIDRVIDLLRTNLPRLLDAFPQSKQHAFVSRHVNAAKLAGFHSVLDVTLYVAVMLKEGEKFIESPTYPKFLNEIKARHGLADHLS